VEAQKTNKLTISDGTHFSTSSQLKVPPSIKKYIDHAVVPKISNNHINKLNEEVL
jgi:hypothetical protein